MMKLRAVFSVLSTVFIYAMTENTQGVLSLKVITSGADDYAASWHVTKQSSLYKTFVPELAVDSNHETCSHTQSETDPWWRLELRNEYTVNTVSVTNTDTIYYDRINGAVIRVGNRREVYSNPICAVISTIPPTVTANFSCGGLVGRYVIIHIPGDQKILSHCETKVYGYTLVNVALWRNARQSSTYGGHYPTLALDGQRFPNSHTGFEMDPWWRVDLLNEHRVDRVAVTNTNGTNYDWLNGAVIRVGSAPDNYKNTICAVISSIPADSTDTFSCGGIVGRYVIIHNPANPSYLCLSEVEVYGSLIGNLASSGSATQSTTFSDWFAEEAIDGDRGFQQLNTSCSSTLNETNPWWRLDLHYFHLVNRVVVTNRVDCCADQLYGAEIRIGNSLENNGNNNPICDVISDIKAGQSFSFKCKGMNGRYVNLIIPGEMRSLTLCELEVYGEGPVFERDILRLYFKSGTDLTDQKVTESILKQLGSAMKDDFLNLTLSWSKTPEILIQKPVKPKSCVKIP